MPWRKEMNKMFALLMTLLVNTAVAKTTSLCAFEAPGDAIQMATPESIEPDDPDSPQPAEPINTFNNQVENNNNITNDSDVNSNDVGAPPAQGS